MKNERGTLESLARHLVAALEPLRRAVSDENAFRALMLRLGWETTGLPPAYTSMGDAIAEAAQAVKALSDDPEPGELVDLLFKTKTAYEKIRGIDSAPPGVDAGAFLTEIGERLFEILLTDYLAAEQTAIFNLLSILNVIEVENREPTAQQRGHVRTRFKWEEIPKIISEPASLPERVYGWGTPDLRFQLLAEHVGEMLFAFGFPVFTGPANDLLADAYHNDDNGLDDNAWLLKVPFYYITIADKNLEAAFTLMELKGGSGSRRAQRCPSGAALPVFRVEAVTPGLPVRAAAEHLPAVARAQVVVAGAVRRRAPSGDPVVPRVVAASRSGHAARSSSRWRRLRSVGCASARAAVRSSGCLAARR